MSASTGRARAERMDAMVPGSVYGVVMTSSPAPIPRASTQVCRAWVPDPVATQNRVPISFAYSFSKVATVPEADWMRHQMPLLVVFTTASTIFSSMCGQEGHDLFL